MPTRMGAIDVLRGLALFGVLAINLVSEFRVPLFEQFLPPSGSIPPLDRAVAAFLSAAVEFKAFALFSFLFGVGLAIQFERLAGRTDRVVLLVRRLLALLAFGLVHLLLIWNGDILTEYAVAGFVILPFLFASQRELAAAVGLALVFYVVLPWPPPGFPGSGLLRAHVAAAYEVYGHGSYPAILAFQVAEDRYVVLLHAYVFLRTVALMLLGVLVWRSGLFAQASARAGLLQGTAVAALALGLVVPALPGWVFTRPTAAVLGALAPVVLALGYAALVVWIVTGTRWASLLAWAAPVGRMAFTNYVTQSVVLGLLFYGYGLGLMGKLGVAAGFSIAVAIYAAQAFASRRWLQDHQFGPLEWLWRTLMYGKRQPWRRDRGGNSFAAM